MWAQGATPSGKVGAGCRRGDGPTEGTIKWVPGAGTGCRHRVLLLWGQMGAGDRHRMPPPQEQVGTGCCTLQTRWVPGAGTAPRPLTAPRSLVGGCRVPVQGCPAWGRRGQELGCPGQAGSWGGQDAARGVQPVPPAQDPATGPFGGSRECRVPLPLCVSSPCPSPSPPPPQLNHLPSAGLTTLCFSPPSAPPRIRSGSLCAPSPVHVPLAPSFPTPPIRCPPHTPPGLLLPAPPPRLCLSPPSPVGASNYRNS